MSASFPSSVKTFTTKLAGDTIQASHANDLQDEVTAIETALVGGTLPAANGSALTSLNASNLASGTAPTARLGSGSASSSTFLRGDSTWATPVSGMTVISTTSTGSQNDFAPGITGDTLIRCNNGSTLTITGLASGVDGQRLVLVSIGAGQVDLSDQSGSSTAANRIITGVSTTLSLAAGKGVVMLVYDATTARWRVTSHEQGDFIAYTPTWGGGSTLNNGTLTGKYYRRGKTIHVVIQITMGSSTSFGGSEWTFSVPFNGVSAEGQMPAFIFDSGTAYYLGMAGLSSVGALSIYTNGAGSAVTSTVPMTWAQNDALRINGSYREA